MCVLRVSGETLDADALIRAALLPGGFLPVARRGVASRGVVNYDVSRAEFSNLAGQVVDAEAYLRKLAEGLRAVRAFPGVTGAVLDFAIEARDVLVHSERFPGALVRLAGEAGLDLMVSQYPRSAEKVRGTWKEARFGLTLVGLLAVICVVTCLHSPAGVTSWFLEVTPGLVYVAVLAALLPRMPLSRWVYVGVFIHVLILIYGGMYTYALTPLGNWMKATFHLMRNPYDRVGHFALGFFPAFTVREILLRRTPLQRGGWLVYIVLSIILAIGAFWELMEWWATLILAGDTGQAFLGSQGDIWDAQWDMLMALIGAAVGLALFSGVHDRAMKKLGKDLAK